MSSKKLSPALLATLGLSACVDGCDPADLPLVGTLFDGSGGGGMVGPCLEMMPCLSPPLQDTDVPAPPPLPDEDPQLAPCLKVVAPQQPVVEPIRVGPCLRMAPPNRGASDEAARRAAEEARRAAEEARRAAEEVITGPCLKIAPPRVGPCLSPPAPRPTPTPTPTLPPTSPEDQGGVLAPDRVDVLASLVETGALAPDVLERLEDG